MLIDITRTIGLDTLVYPGDDGPDLERTDSIAAGDPFNASHLRLSAHCGTHLDAPAHFIADGPTIDQLPLERFLLDAVVIDTGDAKQIQPSHLEGSPINPGSAVLFRTTNGALPRDRFTTDFVCLLPATARALLDLGVGLVGIDYLSVETDSDPDMPLHHILLGNGILILEDVDLRDVEPGRYRLTCFPLRLHGTEASPCRAVLEALPVKSRETSRHMNSGSELLQFPSPE